MSPPSAVLSPPPLYEKNGAVMSLQQLADRRTRRTPSSSGNFSDSRAWREDFNWWGRRTRVTRVGDWQTAVAWRGRARPWLLTVKAHWSLYVPPRWTLRHCAFCPHSVFVCFVWIWEQTAIISLYSINWLVFITETECVYCAVRTGSLYIILRSAHRVYLCILCESENKQRLFPYTALTDWFL